MKKSFLLIFLFICLPCFASNQSIETTLQYKRIGDIAIAPDGQQIAYTLSQIVPSKNGKERDYFIYFKDKNGITLLIEKNEHISSPVWSPDGNDFLYLSQKNKQQQIKKYNVAYHQTSTVVSLEDRNISAYKWSPDGKWIAFVADDEKKTMKKPLTPIDVSHDYTNARLYKIEVNLKNKTIYPLTSNQFSITQVFTPTMDGGFDWSPDGRTIAFSYQQRAGANYTRFSKIALLNIESLRITEIPYMKNNTGSQPIFSPDGKWLAFHSELLEVNKNIIFYSDPNNNGQICVTDINSLKTHCLAPTFNENPLLLGWSSSNDSVFAFDWYKTIGPQIYQLSLDPSIPAKLISTIDGFIQPLTIAFNSKHTHFAFGYELPNQAPEIFITEISPFKLKQVTHLHSSPTILGKSEIIHWKSQDNTEIEGILITPPNYDSKKKYPLLVDIHGGPSGAWAQRYIGGCDEFGDMILPACPKNLMDLGFLVFQPNYRGSSGYGKKFRAANVDDFGGGDYHDIITGVDYLINKGIVDPDHLALFGWSYGGYMTAWAITQSHRFKAAVEGSGLTDLISFSGTTDIPYYLQYYLESSLWENNKLYLQRSPILFTKNVTTPLLILHGQDDKRVPLSQSYELYTALKSQNKTVSMYVFPEQEHILTDGNIIYQSLVATDAWLQKALP